MDADVVVVGGGPVGLLAALGLARAGVSVTVLERGREIGREPRAMVYSYPTLQGFEAVGILDDVEARGVRARVVNHIVHRTGEHITFGMDVLDGLVAHPYNVHLGQDGLSDIILEHLQRHPQAAVEAGVSVTGLEPDADGVTLEVDGQRAIRRRGSSAPTAPAAPCGPSSGSSSRG